MVAIAKRRRGKQMYYYLYHDDKKDKRQQKEIYLGKKIPENINELKKNFLLEIARQDWIPKLKEIKKNFKKVNKKIPKEIYEKNLNTFAIEFTYNTQRIEGSTLTEKDTFLLLEDGITPSNKPNNDIKESEIHYKIFFEILKSSEDLSLNFICKWHKKLFEETKPGFAGLIRTYEVKIGRSKFKPSTYTEVPLLLHKFFQWYNQNKKKLHPVELSALVHQKLVTIHPFGDGNGRATRLMMIHVLNKFDYPLLAIGYGDRKSYYNALERSQVSEDDTIFLNWFMKRYFKAYNKFLK